MASHPGTSGTPTGGSDRSKMIRVLIPAIAVSLILVVVAVIAGVYDGGRNMSDGSNGSIDDPDLKEAEPGVRYRDIKEGSGEACPEGGTVKVFYAGWLADGVEFDSNKKSKTSSEFKLIEGQGGVIPGWVAGIPGMKAGGIRKLVIDPGKAYGNRASGKIPPNSTLIFEVELVSATPGPRPRRSPAPTDLNKLVDGTLPTAEDPNLKTIGGKGLKYRDIKEGDGALVTAGAGVLVDYIGWRFGDGVKFDSSWGGTPLAANLLPAAPRAGVIAGWQEGIPGMKVGGIRKIVIPPGLAYGATGRLPQIPPDATLVFEVEVLQTQ
jgi:FKBP-type peptidyl-prolyl cis-trans isomerase